MANITKKGDRKYLIRVSKGTGKRRSYINKTFRGTLKAARAEGRKMESDMDSGISPRAVIRFEEYLKLWLKAIEKKVAPRTYDGYKGYIERYASKPLGRLRLVDIRNHHIQKIYTDIDKAPGTVRQLHASLNACFSWAVRREYLKTNPCRNVDLPLQQRRDMSTLTESETARFTKACHEMPNGLVFVFALQTGMRPEEYLALRWSDVHDAEIIVQQAVQFNRSGGGFYFKELKTARSRRRIPISQDLRRQLHRHRIEQLGHRMKMKGTWFDHDLVFANEVGRPFAVNNLSRRYLQPIIEKCDFGKHITLYTLRHSCATLLLMLGENPKTVADRLGHSSVVMTLDVYSHVLPHIQTEATAKLDRVMRGKR